MAIAFADGSPDRAVHAAERARRAGAAYRAAVRHSRLVRVLRWAIPLGASISFAIFVIWPFLSPLRGAAVSIGAVRMDGSRVTMENPRLSGHRRDNRPFEVTAVEATQDIRRPTIIDMNRMTANMVSADDRRLSLTARSATYDTQREHLQLRGEIRLRTEGGQEADLISAEADFKAGTVRSREAVEVRLPGMVVRADGLEVVDGGAVVSFVGRVSALIDDRSTSDRRGAPAPSDRSAPAPTIPPAAREAPSPSSAPAPALPGATVVDPATGRVGRPTSR